MIKIETYKDDIIHVYSTEGKMIKNARGEVHSEYYVKDGNREQYVEVIEPTIEKADELI